MTESEWLSSTDPQAMLAFLRDRGPVSPRKLRLVACGCCRTRWEKLTLSWCREAVELAERVADGEPTALGGQGAVFSATGDALLDYSGAFDRSRALTVDETVKKLAWQAVWSVGGNVVDIGEHIALAAGRRLRFDPPVLASVLRDLFGNPCRPLSFSPEWRTEAVVALARGVYEEKAFERMPVLADALEDAGCDSTDVLEYCRGPNVHVRGCWVVDLVLGRG